MRNGEPNQYAGWCAIYNGLDQQYRGRIITTFFLFNAAAVPVVFGLSQPLLIKQILSLTGLIIHLGLLMSSARMHRLLRFWITRLAEAEALDDDTDLEVRILGFSHPTFRTLQGGIMVGVGYFSLLVAGVLGWLGVFLSLNVPALQYFFSS